jgi:hypothetical protein
VRQLQLAGQCFRSFSTAGFSFQPFLHRRDFAARNRGVAAWYEDTEAQCYSDYLQK